MRSIRVSSLGVAVCAAALLLPESAAHAGDDQGQYAVRGAGLISCALFGQARAAQDGAYLAVAAWVDGYVTGINQFAPQTYDVLSFESTELLMAVVDEHCRKNPSDPVLGVIANLFSKLWPDRLTGESRKVTLALGAREASHYVETLERMQRALQAKRLYEGPIDGDLSPPTIDALKRFQESVGFMATGFPDQTTLWRLLRAEE